MHFLNQTIRLEVPTLAFISYFRRFHQKLIRFAEFIGFVFYQPIAIVSKNTPQFLNIIYLKIDIMSIISNNKQIFHVGIRL